MNILSVGIEAVDVGYIYALQFFVAFLLISVTDRLIGPVSIKIPTYLLIIQLMGIFWVCGILLYVTQYIMKLVPRIKPREGESLDNYYLSGGWLFAYVFLGCSVNVQDRLFLLYNRIMGTNYPLINATIRRQSVTS
jgi:hypothetical protein